MKLLEQAVRMSRDGFSANDIEVLEHMRTIQVDVGSEVDKLSTPNAEATGDTPTPPPPARSSLDSF